MVRTFSYNWLFVVAVAVWCCRLPLPIRLICIIRNRTKEIQCKPFKYISLLFCFDSTAIYSCFLLLFCPSSSSLCLLLVCYRLNLNFRLLLYYSPQNSFNIGYCVLCIFRSFVRFLPYCYLVRVLQCFLIQFAMHFSIYPRVCVCSFGFCSREKAVSLWKLNIYR